MPSWVYAFNGENWHDIRMDPVTRALYTLREGHYHVHAGNAFTVADTVACDTSTVKWQVATKDSNRYAHFIFTLTATGEATFLVTEGADRDNGEVLVSVNRRRVEPARVAETIVSRNPTGGTTDGDAILFTMRNGITNLGSKNVEGGDARATNEWILKPDMKYVVSITTYAAVYATCLVDWYEHEGLER